MVILILLNIPFNKWSRTQENIAEYILFFTLCYVPLKSQMGTQVTMLCPIDNAFTDL